MDAIALFMIKYLQEYQKLNPKSWFLIDCSRHSLQQLIHLNDWYIVVGEYDYVETEDSNGVSIRVYTPVGKKEHGNFALDIASKILPFYAEYFNIKYPIAADEKKRFRIKLKNQMV
ncbi:unnamed protein product [Rotaria sp. Silwood1]|nr:unnamed protein product [Rotaria sp. Silwood1]